MVSYIYKVRRLRNVQQGLPLRLEAILDWPGGRVRWRAGGGDNLDGISGEALGWTAPRPFWLPKDCISVRCIGALVQFKCGGQVLVL